MQKGHLTNPTFFIIRTLNKLEIEGNFLNQIKSIYEKFTANIILKGERLKTFLLKLRARQRYQPLSLICNTVLLEAIVRAIKQGEMKGIQTDKKSYNSTTKDNTIKMCVKKLTRYFSQEDIQKANNY